MSSSTVRSFRIDKDFSEILNSEAERMGISVNAMINSVLKQYTEFTRFQSKLDMIIINREIFKTLLNCITEENAYNMGIDMGKDIPNDTILFWKKKVTSSSVLDYVEKILCTYGYIGTYDELESASQRIIVIRHRLGVKGSKFLLGYIKSLMKHTLNLDLEINITDYSLKIQFPVINET